MNKQLLNYYEAIERASADMLEAARMGDWDQVVKLEGACAVLITQLKGAAQHESLKADEAKAKADKEKGVAFADKAAKEPGAQKLASGLVYKDLKAGQGPTPKDTDTVKVHYRGTLIDGTEFDSSYKRNAPAEFALKGVIPCWTEGVQKMKVGGKAKLVCPSSIAYGDNGHPPTIPGGATLVFEVELLEVKAAAAPNQSTAPGK